MGEANGGGVIQRIDVGCASLDASVSFILCYGKRGEALAASCLAEARMVFWLPLI